MRVAEFSPFSLYAPRAAAPARAQAVFRLPEAAETGAAQAARAATADSIVAERRMEQRRRIVRSGRGLLDALDQVKLGLLSGDASVALQSLSRRLDQAGERANDPALDDILDHIRLRADVELAKAQARKTPTF